MMRAVLAAIGLVTACGPVTETERRESPHSVAQDRWMPGLPAGAEPQTFLTESMLAEFVESAAFDGAEGRAWHATKSGFTDQYWVRVLIGDPPFTEYFSYDGETGEVISEVVEISTKRVQ